jgi:hypothetical protein
MKTVFLQQQANGDVINWGRHATVNGQRGEGGASWYRGEAARIMRLVLKHSKEIKNGNA